MMRLSRLVLIEMTPMRLMGLRGGKGHEHTEQRVYKSDL